MKSDRMELKTSLEDVIRLFGPEGMIYSRDHDVFLRELVQNALDAIEVRRATGGDDSIVGTIHVTLAVKDGPMLDVEDTGWGMDEYAVREHLAHPLRGIRRYEAAVTAAPAALIGRFGVGLLSAFKVSDCIEVETRRQDGPPISFMIGIRRGASRPLAVEAYIGEGPDRPVGTRVRVHLRSADAAVAERGSRLMRPMSVVESLRHYVRHPPPGVRITFKTEDGRKVEIADQPMIGAENEFVHRIDLPGVRGCIALPGVGQEGAGAFRVCYRGILVKTNYPTLLPDEAGGLIGEIDVVDARAADPSLSREEFLDNEKFKQLRECVRRELETFNAKIGSTQLCVSAEPETARPAARRTQDGSAAAYDLLAKAEKGPFQKLAERRILHEVDFNEALSGKWMTLPRLVEHLRKLGRERVFVGVQSSTALWIGRFDGRYVYRENDVSKLAEAVAREHREPLLMLRSRFDPTGRSRSYREWVEPKLKELGIAPVACEKVLERMDRTALPTGGAVKAWLAAFPKAIGATPRAHVVLEGEHARNIKEVYLNRSNPRVASIFGDLDRLKGESGRLALAEMLVHALAWRPDLVEERLLALLDPPVASRESSERHLDDLMKALGIGKRP